MTHQSTRVALACAAAALLTTVLGGCGGGGGGGGGSTPAPPAAPAVTTTTVSGTVLTAGGAAAPNYRVAFDGSGSLTATTNGQGQFTLTVPNSSITGSDTLTVYDSLGSLAGTQPVTANGTTITVTLTAPPAPTAAPPPPTGI